MKIKNFKLNKKKIISLLLAGGICLCSRASADITSYNQDVVLRNGSIARLYFTTNINDTDYAYVSFEDKVGYIYLSHINTDNLLINNDYHEINDSLTVSVDKAYLYQTPNIDDTKVISQFDKNSVVNVMAKNDNGWYIVNANGITGFMHENCFTKDINKVTALKVLKNNINIRRSATVDSDIIGFADTSDVFSILGWESGWYIIDYLGDIGYVRSDLVDEIEINKDDLNIQKMGYLVGNSSFYLEDMKSEIILPSYQNVAILNEGDIYDKVMVDGVIGYINKENIKKLSKTCVVVDLSRQILRVYKNNKEIYRCHIISGRESMQTQMGCFKIGHKVKGYQLTADNYVDYWIQYDGNRGLHDASWQKDKYFKEVANKAYDNYASGYGKTYPYKHGSHGCNNMRYTDVKTVYNLVSVGDNVLVIGPNNLIRNHVIGYFDTIDNYIGYEKVKKLV